MTDGGPIGVRRLVQDAQGALHGPPGPRYVVLVRDEYLRVERERVLGDPVAPVPHHDGDPLRIDLACRDERMAQQGSDLQRVEDLRCLGTHPGARACGKDDDGGGARCAHELRLPGGRLPGETRRLDQVRTQSSAAARSAPRIRTWTARLQRPACCHYTRADRPLAAPSGAASDRLSLPGSRTHLRHRCADLHNGRMASESKRAPRSRMTGKERREQLLDVSRRLFAEKGFEGTSIEEIASRAEVSKPVVYEHFGGKEGIYAVVVDREIQALTE